MSNHQLRQANQEMICRYAENASHFLTLTMYQSESKESYDKTISLFIKRLNKAIKGKKAERHNKYRITAIAVIEGKNHESKHVHAHLILGDIPEEKQSDLENIISSIISEMTKIRERKDLQAIYCLSRLANYLTKEIGYYNDNVVNWEISSIPRLKQ